jgi:hypothetical protein
MHNQHALRLRLLFGLTAIMALLAMLGGCGEAETVVPTHTPTRTLPPVTPPTATPIPPTPTPLPTPTPTVSPYINPLTGEHVDDPSVLERVPVAIKITNWPPQHVRPQAGINAADLIFEHYNEGYFASRWTAIYLDEDPIRVGPVRSGRLIDLELPAIYKAIFACWGYSNGVAALVVDSDLYPDWMVSYSLPATLDPDPFYRDETRDVPLEHTGYTSPDRIRAWAEQRNMNNPQDLRGMEFSDEPPEGAEPATYIQILWRELNTEWRYDETSGRYLRWSDGVPHTDFLDGQQLSAANVVVLYVPHWNTDIVEDPHSGAFSIQFALWDSNRAIVFRDGVQIPSFWQRWERWDMLTVTDEEGTTIPFKVGNTFFEIIPTEGLDVIVTAE